jgi:hypothetical protein
MDKHNMAMFFQLIVPHTIRLTSKNINPAHASSSPLPEHKQAAALPATQHTVKLNKGLSFTPHPPFRNTGY